MKVRNLTKRICMILVVALVIGLMPNTAVFAAETVNTVNLNNETSVIGDNIISEKSMNDYTMKSVSISGIIMTTSNFEIGKKAGDTTVVSNDSNVILSSLKWEVKESDNSWRMMSDSEVFEAGKTYQAVIEVVAANGYDFSGMMNEEMNYDVRVDDQTSYVIVYGTGKKKATVLCTMPTLKADIFTYTQQPVDVTCDVNHMLMYTFKVDRTPDSCELQRKHENNYWSPIYIYDDIVADQVMEKNAGWWTEPHVDTYRIASFYNGKIYYSDEFTGTWISRPKKANYTVKHMQEKLDKPGEFEVFETETLEGKIGEQTEAVKKQYTGFNSGGINVEQKEITEDGQTEIEIYYYRNSADIIFEANDGSGRTAVQKFCYGQPETKLNKNPFIREGYTFVKWTGFESGAGKVFLDESVVDPNELCSSERSITYYFYAQWAEEESPIKQFVARLYSEILGREGDEAGLNSWTEVLQSHKETGAKVAMGFVDSAEFKNKPITDEEYVKIMYRTFLGRDADEGGLQGWLQVLDEGMSRLFVFRGFVESPEFTKICDSYGIIRGNVDLKAPMDQQKNEQITKFVSRCYKVFLGRKGDPAGVNGWVTQLVEGNNNAKEAAHGFVMSNEFQSKGLSNEDYVRTMYVGLMNREADEGGLNAWVGVLKRGGSREEIFHGFADLPEFKDLTRSYGLTVNW